MLCRALGNGSNFGRGLLLGRQFFLGRWWGVQRGGWMGCLVRGLFVFGDGGDGALGRLGEFVVVNLDVLLELAVFVPLFDFDKILDYKK